MKPFNAFVIAAAIVRKGDRILLLEENRQDVRKLNMPGGRVRPFDAPSDTAIREVKEETGLDIRLTGLVGVIEGTWSDGGKFAKFVFEGERIGGEERPEKDTCVHWLTQDEILDPARQPAPLLTIDEDMLKEYFTSKKTLTPFFYTWRDEAFERIEHPFSTPILSPSGMVQ